MTDRHLFSAPPSHARRPPRGPTTSPTSFSTSLANHVRWLVPANSPYRSVEDLRGKQIVTLPKNSDAYRSTQLACAVNGIDFEKEYKAHPVAALARRWRRPWSSSSRPWTGGSRSPRPGCVACCWCASRRRGRRPGGQL
ncbi:hypothetical protein ACIQGO_17505 [Streptomyces shenzhenensis]|uniref:hypothetical protein n=1 Tax=Streptomyces shenzhenensis TaxID=943815 RepID=UPI0037F9E938